MTRKASLRTITRNLCGLLCFSLSSKAFVGSSQRRHTMQRSLAEEGAKFPSRKNIVVGANDDGTSARKRSERPKRRAAGMPTRPTPPFEGAAVEEENEEEVTVEQYQDIAVVTDYTPAPDPPPISASQCDAVANFLNESEQQDDLLSFTSTWGRPLADEMRSANGWSQGSFQLTKATVRAVSSLGLVVDCHVKIKPLFFGAPKVEVQEGVEVQFIDALYENDADGAVPKNQRQPPSPSQFASYFGLTRNDGTMTAEEVKRAIVSMARRIGNFESSAKILRRCPTDADGTTMVTIQDNLFTNNVPNSLDTRYVFYDAVVEAVEKALRDPASPKRMRVDLATPELDPSMDSFRIGTLLEMLREIATRLACSGRRVRICVQAPMGRGDRGGLPLSLNGVRRILEMMDWQSQTGQACEGIVPNYIRFGAIGAEEVDRDESGKEIYHEDDGRKMGKLPDDDIFLLVAPQNIIGFSILPALKDMVESASGRPMILFNPKLDDIKSTEDVMSVRGRAERMAFAASWKPIYSYKTVYPSPSVYYPIVGAVCKAGPREPYVAFERQEERVQVGVKPWSDRDGADSNMFEQTAIKAKLNGKRDDYFVNTAGVKLRERHIARATYDNNPTDSEVLAVFRRNGAKW